MMKSINGRHIFRVFFVIVFALITVICNGCASISEEEQSAINCVKVLRRSLVDVQSLEIRDDIIHVSYEDTKNEYDYIAIGYKDRYGTMHDDTILFCNGEIQGSVRDALALTYNKNAKTAFTTDYLTCTIAYINYTKVLDGKLGEDGKSVIVSGEKVAKETSSTFVKLR